MVKSVKEIFKKILIIAMIMITLIFFVIDPYAKAAQLPAEGEFYYAGTTKGTYVVTENIFEWLKNHLSDIIDWILGFITMLFRMSFVGWATIFEWLLTSTLESTIGIDGLNKAMSSTNLTSTNDSSQNVTVEAIVYNNVPLFNVDFFDFEVDVTKTGTGRDLTVLVCKSCKKNYDECTCTDCLTKNSKCVCCKTKIIMTEMAANAGEKNIVIMIKKTVAEWFYVIRLIAIAGMLVVLIAIGIKIAISTLASEKAVYKRMLVDWLVGFIFLFAIEYIIFFIISINSMLVDSIEKYAKSPESLATQITKAEFGDTSKTNEELEIGVYEAVRSRAYDIKLINGLTGMVMYITLVVFAWRYSWMYLKRYFTLIVLTLMAPAVAFSYAMQKVFTGKAKSWSTWLQEYVVNVLIQTVHAILYASFVSIALAISLNSVAGMIVAFILMNFMLKADKIFRKIFKMSSDGSLLDRVSKGAEEARFDKMLKSAQSAIVGAKPAMNILAKTPAAAAIRTTTQATVAGAVGASAKLKHALDERAANKYDTSAASQPLTQAEAEIKKGDQHMANVAKAKEELKALDKQKMRGSEKNKKKQNLEKYIAQEERAAIRDYGVALSAANAADKKMPKLTAESAMYAMSQEERRKHMKNLAIEERDALHEAMQAQAEGKSNKEQRELYAKFNKLKKERQQFERMAKRAEQSHRGGGILDYNKYFDENGKRKVSYEYNPATGKIEKNGLRSKVMSQMNMEGLFGMDKKETELAKKAFSASMSGFVGMGAMFLGVASLVTSPSMGMGFLAYGASKTASYARTNRNLRTPSHRSKYYNKNYHDMEFSSGAIQNMAQVIQDEIDADLEVIRTSKGRRYKGTRKQAKARLAQNRKKQEAMMVVEQMYGRGEALDTRRGTLRLADSAVDQLVGGLGEALDEWAAYDNERQLQDLADFERELVQVKGKAQEIDLYRALGELDRVSAMEDRDVGALLISEDGNTRIVIGDKPITDKSAEILEQAILEVRGITSEDTAEQRKAKLDTPLTEEQRKQVVEKVKELSAGKETGTFDTLAQATEKAMDDLGVDDATKKAYEEQKAEKRMETKETPDIALGKTIDDLIVDAMKEIGMDTGSGTLSVSMKGKVIQRVKELAADRGIDLKERFKEEHGSSIDFNASQADQQMQQAMEKAFEKKVFDQIDAKINAEIVSKVDGAVSKLKGFQSDVEIKVKRKDIKLDNVEEAAKKYEITEEEKAAIATVVKEKIRTEKYKSVEDIQKNKDKIVESYIAASQGKVSGEEAAVQVEVFMQSIKEENTLKGRAKSAISTGLKTKVEADSKAEKVEKKVNIIQQMRQGITAPTTSTATPETIAEQNRVVEGLLSKMSETYRMNAETADNYGKKSENPVDYKQYVKIQGSSTYQAAKKSNKTGRAAHLTMGQDPGVYGPLVGLEKIVKNM